MFLFALIPIVALIAYAGMFLIGIPDIAIFNRYGFTQWWQYTLAGAGASALLALPMELGAALFFGAFGGAVALTAWFIAYFRLQAHESDCKRY